MVRFPFFEKVPFYNPREFFEKFTLYKKQPLAITSSDSIPIKEEHNKLEEFEKTLEVIKDSGTLEEFEKTLEVIKKYIPDIVKPAPKSPPYTIFR